MRDKSKVKRKWYVGSLLPVSRSLVRFNGYGNRPLATPLRREAEEQFAAKLDDDKIVEQASVFFQGGRLHIVQAGIESEEDLEPETTWTVREFSIPIKAVRTRILFRRRERNHD